MDKKIKITIECGEEKFIYEGDIALVSIANKEDYKIGTTNIAGHILNNTPNTTKAVDYMRVHQALGAYVYKECQELIYNTEAGEKGCLDQVEDLVPVNLKELPY